MEVTESDRGFGTADAEHGRAAARSLLAWFGQHPLGAALAVYLTDLLVVMGVSLAAKQWLPADQADVVALVVDTLIVAGFVTFLGWWRVVGYNARSEWRDLRLLWLPAVVILVLPLLSGIKPVDYPAIGLLIVGYLLVGIREETLYRGVLLRILGPMGPMRAIIISSVFFALAHLTNLLVRSNPAIVGAQAVGAFCDGFGFAALRLRTNTIWFLVILHALHDLLLRYTLFPAIALDVVQVTILLIYGLYIMRKGVRQTLVQSA